MKYFSLIMIITILLTGCYSRNKSQISSHAGSTIPSFRVLLADGIKYYDTKKLSNDKPTVFFCFGPHCPYSQAQMEEIISRMPLLTNIEFILLTPYTHQEMLSFYTKNKLDKYSNIITGVDYSNFFINYFKIEGVPYMAIYGKDQKLIQTHSGILTASQIINIING